MLSTAKRLKKILTGFLRYFAASLLVVLFLFTLQYYATRIHRFEEGTPFAGDHIYNPYEGIDGNWQRANFHAHASAWGGITEGQQTPGEVASAYRNAGYDIVSISDYMKINLTPLHAGISSIPVYEHGYNVRKTHQLVLDAYKPLFLDFPLLQGKNQKQTMIDILKKKSGHYLGLAHPKFFGGYTPEDLRYLSGYDFIEVLNHYRTSDRHWDEALSYGRLAWLLSNDDCHDIRKPSETFRMWNMIGAGSTGKDEIFAAMKAGRHYGVNHRGGEQPNLLDSVQVTGTKVEVFFRKPADRAEVIGRGGMIKKTIEGTAHVSFRFSPEDPYLRVVAYNGNGEIWLNPFIRYDGRQPPDLAAASPPVLLLPTIAHIGLWFLIHLAMIWAFLRLIRRK